MQGAIARIADRESAIRAAACVDAAKMVEPAIVSLPAGELPRTRITAGLEGSSLKTSMVADLKPRLVGAKRIGAGKKPPGAINKG